MSKAKPAEQKQIKDISTAELGLLLGEVMNQMNALNQDRVSITAELEKRKTDG